MTHPDPMMSSIQRVLNPPVVVRPASIERRSKVRFPLDLQVRYRTLGRGRSLAGMGWVVNMSSGGVLVAFQHQISSGTRMELNIEWPTLLDGEIPLRLVTVGEVVRCGTDSFAMMLSRHQFRTKRRTVIPIDGPSLSELPIPISKAATFPAPRASRASGEAIYQIVTSTGD